MSDKTDISLKGGAMGMDSTKRDELLKIAENATKKAFGAIRTLREDLDGVVNRDDFHEVYEKATEQSISLIVDAGYDQNDSDDMGWNTGDLLQATLMMAVMLKSDILDHLDE